MIALEEIVLSNLRELTFEELVVFQQCPQKFLLQRDLELDVRSRTDMVVSCIRRHLSKVISHCLTNGPKPREYYLSLIKGEISKIDAGDPKFSSRWEKRTHEVLTKFMNYYAFGKHVQIAGGPLPAGITEKGHRIIGRTDFSFESNIGRTGTSTVLAILDFSSSEWNSTYNSALLQAALVREHYLREAGINPRIIIHNLVQDEKIEYDDDGMHDNLIESVVSLVKMLAGLPYYFNVGPWCGRCPVIQNCYKKMRG